MATASNLMREAWEQAKEFPAVIHCAGDLGTCESRPVGYNVVNRDTELEFCAWACEWHIAENGVWLIEKDIVLT